MKSAIPERLETKMLSILGYLAVVFSLFLASRFLWDYFEGCGQDDGSVVPISLLFGLTNLGIAVSLFFAVWGLRHRSHLKHALLTFCLIVCIVVVQLFVATYVIVGTGSGCAV